MAHGPTGSDDNALTDAWFSDEKTEVEASSDQAPPTIATRGDPTASATDPELDIEVAEPPRLLVELEALPALPAIDDETLAGLPAAKVPSPPTRTAEELEHYKAQIGLYEREAKARGSSPEAAQLYLEMGRLWEEQLGKQRNAAMCYQRAFHLDKKDPNVLHAARRLFTEVENPGMIVYTLQAEIDATDAPEHRAALMAEKAIVLESKTDNSEEAEKSFRDALEVWAAEPLAILSLEQLHLARGDHEALYKVYQRAIVVAQTAGHRLPLLIAAAQLAEDRLDDVSSAISHYEQVLLLAENHPLALAALRRLYAIAGRWEDLVRTLIISAAATKSKEKATAYLVAASKVELDRLNAADRALVSMLKALEHSPKDVTLLREIVWLYEANGRHVDVAKVLKRTSEIVRDPVERVPALFRLGVVLEEKLDEHNEAMHAFEEAVRLDSSYTPAIQALGRLYERSGKWAELAKLYETELEAEQDLARKIPRLFKVADLYETRLDDVPSAVARLEALLEIDSAYAPAHRALGRLLLRTDQPAALVKLYERELASTEDTEHKVFLLSRMARLHEERLSDVDQAVAQQRRILEIDPKNLEAIRALIRLSEAQQRWDDVLAGHEAELEATEDQKDVVQVLHRIGMLHEERRDDLPSAIDSYEKVVCLAPTYLPALRSLGRLYHRQGRWDDLVVMFRREVDASEDVERQVSLLFRMGEILVDRSKADGRAAEIYREILDKQPTSRPSLHALAQIYARLGKHAELVEVLQKQADLLSDPQEKSKVLVTIAEHCEHELGQPDRAAELYQEVLRIGASQEVAVEALVRIFSTAGLWGALALALKSAADVADEASSKGAILVRAAEIYEDKLEKVDMAIECLEAAHALAPDDTAILGHLERLYVAHGRWPEAIEAAERLGQRETDPRTFADRCIRIANMLEVKLDPPKSGAEYYRRALERVPGHPIALRGMELAYRRANSWEGLVALYRREGMVTYHPRRRAMMFFRAGDLAEHRLSDIELADRLYADVLSVLPKHMPALNARRRLALARGDAATALECTRVAGEAAADPERGVELLFEAGRIYQDDLGDMVKARSSFETVLERNAQHAGASERLEAILRQAGESRGLVDVLLRRADTISDPELRLQTLLDAGDTAQNNLNDAAKAVEIFKQARTLAPDNADVLTRMGPLLVEVGEKDDAMEVFLEVVESGAEPNVQASAFRALGVLYQDHKSDLVKAVQSFQAAFSADPHDTDSLSRLAGVYREAKDWGSAVNVMLRLAEVEKDVSVQVTTLLDLGAIYREYLDDDDKAIRAYGKARELTPSNLDANLALIELFEKTENWSALAEVADGYLRALPQDKRGEAVPLHIRLAEIYDGKLKDPTRATNELRQALVIEPQNPDALQALARLYAAGEETFPQAVDIHRRMLRMDPFRVESYHEIRHMFEKRREFDKAFVICEILVFLRAQKPEEDLLFHEFRDKVALQASGKLSADDHDRLIPHADERGAARSVFSVLATELAKVLGDDIGRFGLNPRTDRHGPRSDLTVRRLADDVAAVLGAPTFDLWVSGKHELELFTENTDPVSLIVGSQFDRRLRESDKRFLLARQLERLRAGHQLFDRLAPEAMRALVSAAARIADDRAPICAGAAAVDAMQRKIVKAISRKARRGLDELRGRLDGIGTFDATAHVTAARHSCNRAGLVMTNDIDAAIRALAREEGIKPVFSDAKGAAETVGQSEAVRELLAFAISEEYFRLRAKLGFSIQA